MKAKNLKPMIISALLAVGFGATTVGTSFALFTDSVETNINITAGKVDVSGELKGLTLYSAEANAEGTVLDENNAKYNLVEQNGSFKNGGTAVINGAKDTLTLTNITPGDKVAFTFDLGNTSNVNIKYRLGYEVVNEGELNSTAYLDLVKGLETTVGAEKFNGLKTYKSAWTDLAANAELSDVSFSIYMPMNKDNRYQSKTAKIKLYVEAVQGNAVVSGGKEVATVEEDIISPAAIVVENTDTVLEAENADQTVTVKTTIPAAAQLPVGRTVELNVSNLEAEDTEDSTVKNLNFDLTLTVNGEEVEEFSELIDVEIDIGPGYEITNVTHKGTAITNYTYDIDEGIIRFQTKNFSPFTVSYRVKTANVQTYEQLKAALAQPYAVVTMLNDITMPSGEKEVPISNNVHLNGNNKKLLINTGETAFKLSNDDVTITNLTIDDTHVWKRYLISLNGAENLVFDNCNIVSKEEISDIELGAIYCFSGSFDSMEIINTTIEGFYGCFYGAKVGVQKTLRITGSTIESGAYTFNFSADLSSTSAEVYVTNSTLKGWTSYGNLRLVSFTNVQFRKSSYGLEYNYFAGQSRTILDGCYFEVYNKNNMSRDNNENFHMSLGDGGGTPNVTTDKYELIQIRNCTYNDLPLTKNTWGDEIIDEDYGINFMLNGEKIYCVNGHITVIE